jgi:hypothetical protein
MSKLRNGEGKLSHYMSHSIEVSKEKCQCGNIKFSYQEVCGKCYLKKLTKENKCIKEF